MTLLTVLLCSALLWLIGCALWSILLPERRVWPPPRRDGFVQRMNAVLGPLTPIGLFVVSVGGWETLGLPALVRVVPGLLLLLPGAYLSLAGAIGLGVDRNSGMEGELLESGPYRFSRNPQYTGSVLAYAGLALLFDSAPGLATTALSAGWFLLLPFAEEPWLREKLGAPYEAYSARVPRYLGFHKSR